MFRLTLANQKQTLCAIRTQKKRKKISEIYTGTQRLADIAQEHEKLRAKFTWVHEGLQLNHKKMSMQFYNYDVYRVSRMKGTFWRREM